MSKVVVIGNGHGGMAAAARLKVKGHEVTLFKTSPESESQTQPLTLLGAYRDLFLKTGAAIEDDVDLLEVDSALKLELSNGEILNIPASGIGRTISAIESSLGKDAGAQWRNYVTQLGQLWLKIRQPLIENRDSSTTSLLRNVGISTIWKFRSLAKLQSKYLEHQELRNLASSYRAQINYPTDNDSGLLGINAYVQQNFGVYLPHDGFSKLTEALENRCKQLGVLIEVSDQVKPVELAGQICGVEKSGRFSSADLVIVSGSNNSAENRGWLNLPDFRTATSNLFEINEQSWLGLGPAHAVLTGEIIANHIGSAS